MNAVRDKANLSEKTVQKIAKGTVKEKTKPSRTRRVFNTKVKVTNWYDGVDPRIVLAIQKMKIAPARLEVKSPTEVIIHNRSIRKSVTKK